MAITSFVIGVEEVNPRLDSFEIRETAGGVSTMTCDLRPSEGSPLGRYTVRQEVAVEEDGVGIFGGKLTQTRERGDGAPNLYDADGQPEILQTLTSEDYVRLADNVSLTETVADGTPLETFLIVVVGYLSTFGITLHPSQVTGPNLPAMSFVRKRVSEVLQALSDATGFLWRIDYDKQLRMWQQGDLLAPFDIDEFDSPAKWTDDVEVEQILDDDYANRIIVEGAPVSEVGRIESFTGDGTAGPFPLEYTVTTHKGHLTLSTGGGETMATDPADPGVQWELDPVTNSLTRLAGNTVNGTIYSINFDGTFQAIATAEDAGEIAANGLVEHVESRDDITSQAAAQDLADTLLAERLNASEQVVRYKTRYSAPTLRAGQLQTITAPSRGLSGTYIISDMSVRAEIPLADVQPTEASGIVRSITAKRQALTGKWQHTYRDWLGGGARSAASSVVQVGSGGVSSGGPGLPFKSVQVNRDGAFGGDADFTYDEDTNSLVCGALSSITAADVESCLVVGYDNHIADP